MLNSIWEFISKALRRPEIDSGSKDEARQRLQVVLVQDRFALPGETLEDMKNDLIKVIARYLVIDESSIEVEIKRSEGMVVLVSNIPITGMRRSAAAHP